MNNPPVPKTVCLLTAAATVMVFGSAAASAVRSPSPVDCTKSILVPGTLTSRAVIDQCESERLVVEFGIGGGVTLPEPGDAVTISLQGLDSSHIGTAYRTLAGDLVTEVDGVIVGAADARAEYVDVFEGSRGVGDHLSALVDLLAPSAVASGTNRCANMQYYSLYPWKISSGNMTWYYNNRGEPSGYTTAQYVERLKAGARVWPTITDNCGITASAPPISQSYNGVTSLNIGIDASATCVTNHGVRVELCWVW